MLKPGNCIERFSAEQRNSAGFLCDTCCSCCWGNALHVRNNIHSVVRRRRTAHCIGRTCCRSVSSSIFLTVRQQKHLQAQTLCVVPLVDFARINIKLPFCSMSALINGVAQHFGISSRLIQPLPYCSPNPSFLKLYYTLQVLLKRQLYRR